MTESNNQLFAEHQQSIERRWMDDHLSTKTYYSLIAKLDQWRKVAAQQK